MTQSLQEMQATGERDVVRKVHTIQQVQGQRQTHSRLNRNTQTGAVRKGFLKEVIPGLSLKARARNLQEKGEGIPGEGPRREDCKS
jgi:ribosomal protein L4